MSVTRYLVVANCDDGSNHPISLHDNVRSAEKAAAELTPEVVGECASVSISRTGEPPLLKPISISVFEFTDGKLTRLCFDDAPHVVQQRVRQKTSPVTGRDGSGGAEYAANQDLQPSVQKTPKSQPERKVGVKKGTGQQPPRQPSVN